MRGVLTERCVCLPDAASPGLAAPDAVASHLVIPSLSTPCMANCALGTNHMADPEMVEATGQHGTTPLPSELGVRVQ